MSQPKVVNLTEASKKKSLLPPILHTVRQHARKQLAGLLEGLFNNVDDALFEMADRSRSDADQHLYFESMRELRLKREQINNRFVKEFYLGFELALDPEEEETDRDLDAAVESFSLVGNDELEISVAIAGIVSKVTSQHSLLVMQLTKRIDFLAKTSDVTERMNPLGPERLSQSFATAMEGADLDIKVRIILLKLYERFVMERLAPVYAEANNLLAEAGVLPDLKNIMRTGRNPAANSGSGATSGGGIAGTGMAGQGGQAAGAAGPLTGTGTGTGSGFAGAGGASAADGNFGVIQQLLAAARAGVPSTSLDTSGPILSTNDVLTVLSQAQGELTAPIDIAQVPPVLDLRQVVINRAPQVVGEEGSHLEQSDDDVVNFVSMLFDYILNDRNLAIPMKALIGRLQLPIVKLAVMDRSFFEKSSHPARKLLNELSSAGIGWSSAQELKRDALYNKIESIVLRVMNGFKDDPDIFDELLKDLRAFVNKDDHKRTQVEQRVKDSEHGRAKTINAKATAQKLINQKASGMRLPPAIGRFVSDVWSRVLVYACVTNGEQSASWQRHARTLDELLWCLQPLDTLSDLDLRDAKLAELLDELRTGMADIQLPQHECAEHLREIESHLMDISRNDRAYLEDDEAPEPAADFEVMEEIVLTAPGEVLEQEQNIEIEPEYLDRVSHIREGSWVEMRQEDGELLRCKLATIVEPGGRYIFVNRRGMKVAEKSRNGLAVELKRRTLTVLEESQVFDRALQSVIGNLRQMHRQPAPAGG